MALSKQYKPSFFEKLSGVLGINARNLLYISRYNNKSSKSFADDKMFTKNYLRSRGLGTAKVYAVISNYNDLKNFSPKSLPESFVIKPNRGYGGEGIMVFVSKKGSSFVDISGKTHDWEALSRHISSILDGKYAISGLSDQAIIEERLVAHEFFKQYSDKGLPDIRVIVFNYVPIIAMLRLPTRESSGKANLHLGAIGVGIDIASGQATYAVQHNKFIRRINGEKITGMRIPDWDSVLISAANAQKVSQIGFLAVDIVLTDSGIKILELNARAGLSVQIANQIPLRSRLKKVSDLTVPTPEKGVEICKALFSSNTPARTKDPLPDRIPVGLFEYVEMLNTSRPHVLAKIDPHFEGTVLDRSIAEKEDLREGDFFDIKLKEQRLTLPVTYGNLRKETYKMIIGGKFLDSFIIASDLNRDLPRSAPLVDTARDEKILQNIDKKLTELDRRISVARALRPINLIEEKKAFLEKPVTSPHFIYATSTVPFDELRKELKALPEVPSHPLYELYKNKRREIERKIDLIESIDTPNLQKASEDVYGSVDEALYERAVAFVKAATVHPDESPVVKFKQVVKRIEDFLAQNDLSHWKVESVEGRVSDISVSRSGKIFIRDGITFTENRLVSVIAHEILTHVFRLENARLQRYKLLEVGTAGYLATEEGLAIYNQLATGRALGEKEIWPALRVIAAYLATQMSFVDLFHHMQDTYGLDDESAWRACLKTKRGLADTSKPIAFTRDIAYFTGYEAVKEYIESGSDPQARMRNLYIGKIGIKDLEKLPDLSSFKVRYLPDISKIDI